MSVYIIFIAFIVLVALMQFHKSNKKKEMQIYKNYKRIISNYKDKSSDHFSNEVVYQFIADVDKMPIIEVAEDIKDEIEVIYNYIKNNKSISEDLKLQLRVTLNLKGIKI